MLLDHIYELHEVLGAGSFGTVHRATDLSLDRVVAIKILHPWLAQDAGVIERFRREARTMAQLDHPGIVTVHGVRESEGRFFIVMRYLPGGSLGDRLKNGPLPLAEAVSLLLQVCDALQVAHARGLIHRDLKPANLLFDADGRIVIGDFGLARIAAASSSATSTGGVGTPTYRAPELWRGKPLAGPSADVYALACVLVEMLTGASPFHGDNPAEIMTHHLTEAPDFGPNWPPPGSPPGLAALVARALEKDPVARFADAAALADALRALKLPLPASAAQHAVKNPPAAQAGETTAHPVRPEAPASTAQYVVKNPDGAQAGGNAGGPVRPKTPADPGGRRMKVRYWGWGVSGLCGLVLAFIIFGALTPPVASPTSTPHLPAVIATDSLAPSTHIFTPSPTWTLMPSPTWTLAPSLTATLSLSPTPNPFSDMVLIPAGAFQMGSNQYDAEKPIHTVTLSAFWIDKYEVTNADYARCVATKVCSPPAPTSSFTHKSYYGDSQYARYPVLYVSWDQAKTYCEWRKARLPTEAEWEKAAGGGLEGKLYPWGDEAPVCTPGAKNGAQFGSCSPQDTVAVGTFQPNDYGVYDMAGNVWEWVNDGYGGYPSAAVTNPTGPASGQYRVVRGGGWFYVPFNLRVAYRYSYTPANHYSDIGFRCVASLP